MECLCPGVDGFPDESTWPDVTATMMIPLISLSLLAQTHLCLAIFAPKYVSAPS